MTKKFTALLLAALLTLALPLAAHAAGTELRVVGPAEAPAVGESFEVSVEISGNPGFVSAQLTLAYDTETLTCTEIAAGPVLEKASSAVNAAAKDGARIAAASGDTISGNGVLCTASFTVKKAASAYMVSLVTAKLFGKDGRDAAPGLAALTIAGASAGGDTPAPPVTVSFPDVASHWGREYVEKAAAKGLFTGFEDGTFRPDNLVTRGQFVTVLWRMAGKPAPTKANPFADVPAGVWYTDAVAWAFENGYVNGRSATVFDPEGTITRQEAMKILFAYSGGKSGMELMFTADYDKSFADSGEIASWAKPAMYWGYYNGIIKGKGEGRLSPTDYATRAELAKILVVYSEQ